MKRSEAIYNIGCVLACCFPPSSDYEHVSQNILSMLENAGMLPPKTNKQYNIDKNISATKEVNEWDNE